MPPAVDRFVLSNYESNCYVVRAGALLRFEPAERHSLRSEGGARILLLLTPWPGEGHYPTAA